jgi:hypothetical protein
MKEAFEDGEIGKSQPQGSDVARGMFPDGVVGSPEEEPKMSGTGRHG